MGTPVSVSQLPPCFFEREDGSTPWCLSQALTSSRASGGVLILRIESNVEIGGSICRRVTQVRPVVWDRIPQVLHIHVFLTWCEGRCEAVEGSDSDDKKHREYVTARDIYYNATNPCKGRNRQLEVKRA